MIENTNKVIWLLTGIQDQMSSWIKLMQDDPMFAPPEWMFENIWNTCDVTKRLILGPVVPDDER